jgi:hypothetical protein
MAQLAQVPEESQEADVPEDDEAGYLAEVQRGLDGIKTALYQDKNVSDQFLAMIKPEKKEDSLVRAAILLVTELDKRLDLDESVLAPMAVMASGELIELVEAANGITFDEAAQKRVVMSAFEGVLQAYQVDGQEAADFVAEVGPEAEQQGIEDYSAALNSVGTKAAAQELVPQ